MNLCSQKEIQELLGRYGFRFSKSMGQNFLIEPSIPQETAAASGAGPGIGVLEIGPGIGPLTVQLSSLAEQVVSVELDRSLLPVLKETLADCHNVEVVSGNIMKLDIPRLCQEKLPGLPVVVCANLPYNITTPVLTALLQAECFEAITVMIQREAAQRICAQPGEEGYGAFSVLCRYYADTQVLFDVSPGCFYPPPKVTSSVIRMTVRKKPPEDVGDRTLFFRLVWAAFAQRRKTLLNAIQTVVGKNVGKPALREVLISCDLTERVRGEQLTFEGFAQLSRKIAEIQGS